MRLSLVLLLALLFLSPALAAVNISSCGAGSVISAPGVYTVNASLSGAPNAASTGNACIVIGTDDVIVDCQGNSISHDDSANTEGIIVNATASPLSNITIRNCRIRDYASGVYVEDPAGGRNAVTLTNNTISSNTYGVRIPGVWADVVMVGNLVANNTNSGYFMDDYFGGTIDMTLDRFLGNTADINYTTGMSGFTMDIADVIFGNADGTYGANTTVSHSSSSRSWGMIDWVPAPAAPSANHVSFLNKSVNMTPDYIDLNGDKLFTVTMKWTNAEGVSALQESAIQLWLTNDSGNHLLNSSPDISNNEISASIYLDDSANSSVFSLYRNNGCPIITSPGAYVLDRELSGAPNGGSNGRDACVLIDTDDVVFDCAGHNITHDDSGNNAGIMVNGTTSNRDNITIKNCNVLDYEAGILVDSISSNRQTVNLSNNTLTSNAYGISVPLGYAYVYGRNNLVANNTAGGVYDSSYFGDILDFSQDRFLGNVNDFDYPSGGSGFTLNLVDIILGNPDGSYFANLTLNHTTNDNTWGIIDYVFPPTHPSPAISSFLNKSFNITHDYLVTFGFDDEFGIKLKWGASEGTALQQGFIQMWLFNESGPFLLNGTPDTVNREISVQNYLLNDISNSTVIGLYLDHGCPVVNSPGSYSQSGNFFGAPNVINGVQNVCLLINASNVDWDCSGNTIINDGTDTSFGVYVNGPLSNITIRNCPNVSGYVYGAYVYNSTGVSVRNVTAGGSFQSAFASPYSPVLFDNDTAYGSGNGFYVTTGNNVTNCAAAGNNYGYYLDGPLSTGIRFINDTAALSGNYGFFSTSGANGNYFSLNRAFNSTNDGFYINSNGNNLSNNTAYYNGNAGFSVSGTGNMVDNNSVYNNTEGIRLNAGPNTAFNNDVQDNPGFGFISTGNGNNITGNRGVRNGYGVDVSSCSGNVIASNNFSSGTTGIAVIASTSTSISGNNVFGNSQEGFYLSNSNGTAISNDHVYANLYAFYIQGTAAAASVNLSNVIIDRAAGDFANYTNLSLNDSVSAGSAYRINWTVNSSSPGAAYTSLLGKMVSIGTVSGGVSLDNIVWHYLESDIGALDEDSFVIMKYNGSWSDTGAALDTGANTLALLSMVPSSDYGIFEGFACPVIAAPGTFIQGQDYLGAPNPISGGYACVVIDSDDVAYDCNGFNITNNGTGGTTHGIAFNTSRSNVTIRNCPAISGYTNGLSAQSASNSRIYNSTFFNNSLYGVIVNGGSNVNITNTTSRDNSNSGYFLVSTTNSVLRNNTAYGHPSYGFILQSGSSGNTLDNNTAHSNLIGFGSLIGSNGNAFMNGTAYNNSNSGFYIDTSNNTQLAGNSAYDNAHGFQLTTASGSSLTGNIVRDNTQNGLFVVTSTATNLSNNTIYNNAAAGTFLSVSSGTIIRLDHYYNNGLDLRASAGGSASQLNLSSVIFDSASGTYLNYTNLSINDSIEPSAAYSVDWSPVLAMPDAFHTPFAGKFVNISVISGTPGIDSIFWTWLPSEVTAQYNESMFELWKYNSSGWAMLNTSPDMGAHSLSLYNMNPASVYGILNASDNCPIVTSSYVQARDFIGSPNVVSGGTACVVVNADNLVYDCNGYGITGNGSGISTFGIIADHHRNVTIRNCPGISNYSWGVEFNDVNDSTIMNSSAYNNTYYGFWVTFGSPWNGSNRNIISDNIAHSNGHSGFFIAGYNNNITGNVGRNNTLHGLWLAGCGNNRVLNNTASNNTNGAGFMLDNSSANLLEGNIANSNPRGIYLNIGPTGNLVNQNNLSSNTVGGIVLSQAPLNNLTGNRVNSTTGSGIEVNNCTGVRVYNNTAYLNTIGISLSILSSGSVVALNNASQNTQDGIRLSNSAGSNNVTDNFANSNANYGIILASSPSNRIVGNTANSNNQGIRLESSSDGNLLDQNTVMSNLNFGVLVLNSQQNNVTRNNASLNNYGIYVSASNNRVLGNNASSNPQTGIYVTGSGSSYNLIENNIARSNGNYGIHVSSGGNNYNNLTNNTANLNNDGIRVEASQYCILRNNYAGDNGNNGFYVGTAAHNTLLDNNTATGNSNHGFYTVSSNGCNLTGNSAYNNTQDGFSTSSGSNDALAWNTAYDNVDGFYLSGADAALTSNTAYLNHNNGFTLGGATGATLINNTAYGNTFIGFEENTAASDNLISNSTAYNSIRGFVVQSLSERNNLTGVSAFNNSGRGIHVLGNRTLVANAHLFNNARDFEANGTGMIVNLSGVSFDNAAGNYQNYTNLTLNDTVASAYFIDWTSNASSLPLPPSTFSFAQKYVAITPLSGNVSIDAIAWNWLQAEIVLPYNENLFRLLKFNATWVDTGATLDAGANTLTLNNLGSFSDFAILQDIPASGGDEPEEGAEEGYDVRIVPACQGFIVSVKDGGSPVPDAFITGTDETHATELGARYTNSSGQAFFPDCDIDVSVKAAKSGRQGTDSGMAACGFCPECATDDDCADSEQCSSQQCVPVNCPGGRVVNHACELFECMEDSDCPVGQSCIDHSCKTVYECTYGLANTTADDNADCADNEYCDVPVGQPGGSCKPITGCGDIRNHAITLWECGDLEGCPACNAGELCITHNCVQGDITCPASGIVGDSKTCQAKEDGLPCLNCDYVVTDPAGKNFTGKTDDKGNLNLPLKLAGNYKVTLLRDGEVVKTILVKALPKSPPVEPEKPASGAIDPLFAGLFLIILLALGLVAIMYWRRGKGEKKKQAPPKK
ncbi:MAG: right-handed parallel beta-helix repeat-containing protein [Patescibacteria group bacterium]